MSTHADHFHALSTISLRDRLEQLQVRIGGRLKLGLLAKFTRYGLSRDLSVAVTDPTAKIPIEVRRLKDADLGSLFASGNSREPTERLEVAWRRAFVDKGAKGGYVAVDQRDGTPCYVQWLFGSDSNDFVQRLGGFPLLERDVALLENAYTPPSYRGKGIMSAAMALIAEKAEDIGARHVLTFVDQENIASLKGCQRAGFHPDMLHHRTRLGFGVVTRDRFSPLAPDDPRRSKIF